MTDLAVRLRKARLDAGLGQRELARAADVDVSQISRYERRLGEPRPRVLKRIAEVLSISPEWLASGDPDFDPSALRHEITVRLDEVNEARVREIARQSGRTVSDVVKSLIFERLATWSVSGTEDLPKIRPKGSDDLP